MTTQTIQEVTVKGRSPAFQYYPDKYDTHTRHLSDYAYRVYHRMINWMWLHSPDYCSVTMDELGIAVVLAEQPDKIRAALVEIQNEHMPLLKMDGGRYVSSGLEKEAAKQAASRKRGKDAADKRWSKVNATASNNDASASENDASAMPTQCSGIVSASVKQCTPSPTPTPIPATLKKERVVIDPAIKARIGGWFGRRESTKWSDKEVKALKALGDITEDLDQMEALYTSGETYNRKQIQTLLNNWQGEMDRARQHVPKTNSKPVDVGGNRDANGKPIFQC
jgi:hypothetical protein